MKAMEMGEDMLKELGDFETRSGLLLLSLNPILDGGGHYGPDDRERPR